jgi:hypothetical protein
VQIRSGVVRGFERGVQLTGATGNRLDRAAGNRVTGNIATGNGDPAQCRNVRCT